MTDSVPEKLGKYKIIEEVGRGGFAAVYKAVDTTLDRTVALKVLAPHLLWDPTFVERFQREAKVAANLDHPNIVTIHEVGQMEGVYFIAMQFLEGRTLSQLLKAEGLLPISQVRAIIEQIASALDYAHARGFVHRDIKPSNIMVADDGRATLTDFGLVKAGEGTQLTASGMVFGTPEYMSPEQAEGKVLDAQSDIYSLGVVLFAMLAGRAPFVADTTPAVMYKHVHEPPPLEELPSDLPQGVVAVVEKALAKEREERYRSVGEMARALEEAIEASARVTPTLPEREVPVPPPVVKEPVLEEVAPPLVEPEAVVKEEPKPPTAPPAAKAVPKKALRVGALVAGGLALLCCIVGVIIFIPPSPTPTPEPPAATPVVRVTTPTPTSTPTATPVPPTPTPVPLMPTDTPVPSTPLPPTPPGGAALPTGRYAQVWERLGGAGGALGWGLDPAVEGFYAIQHFEHGLMHWGRQDRTGEPEPEVHIILYGPGDNWQAGQEWYRYTDYWREGDEEYSCPQASPPWGPRRGFGKVWCECEYCREHLGAPMEEEWDEQGGYQNFQGGVMLWVPGEGGLYVLLNRGDWRFEPVE